MAGIQAARYIRLAARMYRKVGSLRESLLAHIPHMNRTPRALCRMSTSYHPNSSDDCGASNMTHVRGAHKTRDDGARRIRYGVRGNVRRYHGLPIRRYHSHSYAHQCHGLPIRRYHCHSYAHQYHGRSYVRHYYGHSYARHYHDFPIRHHHVRRTAGGMEEKAIVVMTANNRTAKIFQFNLILYTRRKN